MMTTDQAKWVLLGFLMIGVLSNLAGCEIAYMPACVGDCDATGGSDNVAIPDLGGIPDGSI